MQRTARVRTLEPSMMLQFSVIPPGCGYTHRHGPRTAAGPHAQCPTHRPWYHSTLLPQQNPHERRRQVDSRAFALRHSRLSTACFVQYPTSNLAPRRHLIIQMLPQICRREIGKGYYCHWRIINSKIKKGRPCAYHSSIGNCQRTVKLSTSQHLTRDQSIVITSIRLQFTYMIPCHLYDTTAKDVMVAAF